MKNWQKTVNYRRIRDNKGKITAYIITVDGTDVEVSEEVYLAYTAIDRRERYYREHFLRDKVLSLDEMEEDGMKLEYVCSETIMSSEDSFILKMEQEDNECKRKKLPLVLSMLSDDEREVIKAVFIQGIGMRELARSEGVHLHSIQYRIKKALEKMKKLFEIC